MKKRGLGFYSVLFIGLIIFTIFAFNFIYFIGKVVGPPENAGEIPQFGPSTGDIECMKKCVTDAGCTIGDVACSEKNDCQTKCNVKAPEETAEQKCVSDCAKIGCSEFDFDCQKANQAKCDEQCGMIKEPEAKSKEEQCIRDCVNTEAPGTICEASQTGETGNELCQRCAKSCEHLYEGPCLGEPKLSERKKACETCENCYGSPVMGDSGEGWECIVDVACKDASSEFGDEPGTGPGIGQEGFVAKVGDTVGNVVGAIGDFFQGIFGTKEETPNSEQKTTPTETPNS